MSTPAPKPSLFEQLGGKPAVDAAVDLFYQEITVAFQPLAAFCESRRREYEPQLQRTTGLQEKLETLAIRLR